MNPGCTADEMQSQYGQVPAWRQMPYELCKTYAIKCMLLHYRLKNASNKYIWNDGITQILIVDETNGAEVLSYRMRCMHKWAYWLWESYMLPGIMHKYCSDKSTHDLTMFVWYYHDGKTFYRTQKPNASSSLQNDTREHAPAPDTMFLQTIAIRGKLTTDITDRLIAAAGPIRDFHGCKTFYVRWLFPEMFAAAANDKQTIRVIVKHMFKPTFKILGWRDALF